jgi:glycosyltransferase involved in cell wall biosynthesis
MTPEPRVSIVIPVKNEERILDRCLDSIDDLDYPKDRIQVIIADGLSTDRSRDIAEGRGAKVVCNPKQTVVSGRNCGFQVADGEYVVFTDADCVVRHDWLRGALKAFHVDTTIAGVGGASRFPENATSFEEAVNLIYSAAEDAGSTAQVQYAESTDYVDDLPGRQDKSLLNAFHILTAVGLPLVAILATTTVLTGHVFGLLIALLSAATATSAMALFKRSSLRAALWFPAVLAIFLSAWSLGFFRELFFPLAIVDGK